MFLDLVIAVCAGFAAAGPVLLVYRLLRRKPSLGVVLGVAAVAIMVVATVQRYGWADQAAARLPPEMVVIDRLTVRDPFQPLSYIVPVVDRLVVADTASRRTSPAHPDMVAMEVVLVRKGRETLVARHLVDCAERATTQLPADTRLGPGPLPDGLAWFGGVPDGLFEAACPPA
ncbi:MAG: hypothetical protein RID91_17755 [Azospirillaceae bacterium]